WHTLSDEQLRALQPCTDFRLSPLEGKLPCRYFFALSLYNGFGFLATNNRHRARLMRWQQTEFLLKGVYLGLLVLVALQEPTWAQGAQTALITLGGLVLCLGIAAVQKLREGYRVRGRLVGFILFLILENPLLVYSGLVLGLTLGAYFILNREMDETLLI